MESKVYVAAINDAKNGNVTLKRFELRQEIERPATTASGKIGFLLNGATGPKGTVMPNVEKRVCWENVSVQNIQKYGLKAGDILENKFGMPCRIKVLETTEPQYAGHAPKINPSTNEVLKTAEGKSIYRTSTLTFNTLEKDTLIVHSPVAANAIAQPSTVFNSVEKIQS